MQPIIFKACILSVALSMVGMVTSPVIASTLTKHLDVGQREDRENKSSLMNVSPVKIEAPTSPSKTRKKHIQQDRATQPFSVWITSFTSSLKGAQRAKQVNQLKKLLAKFQATSYLEKEWEALARTQAWTQWSQQSTWKQVCGGYLFYPAEFVETYRSYEPTASLLNRYDIKLGLKIAGHLFHYPRALYIYATRPYLSTEGDRPAYYAKLRHRAMHDFMQEQNQDAYELQGDVWEEQGEFEKAISCYQRAKTNLTQFKLALLTTYYKTSHPPLSSLFYEQWATRSSYGPAYRALIKKLEAEEDLTDARRIEYLEKAIALGDPHAHLELGQVYTDQHKLKQAEEHYLAYGCHGYSPGYIKAVSLYLKNPISSSSIADLKQAKVYAAKALDLRDPAAKGILNLIQGALDRDFAKEK